MKFELPVPAYGMPDSSGSVNRPAPVRSMQPPPPGDGGMPPVPMIAQERTPTGSNRMKASPPTSDPALDPNTVPGSDLNYDDGFPGFPGDCPPKVPPFDRIESIDIIDGSYLPCQEPYADIQGEIGHSGMKNVTYYTDRPCLNGIYISSSDYEIDNCSFTLNGNGVNDFGGIGAGIMTDGEGRVVIRNTDVTTSGVLRSCLATTGHSDVLLEDCTLIANGGPIPDTYVPRIGSGMVIPPPGVDVGGSCRTYLSMGRSNTVFNRCKIVSDGWAVMSTDCCEPGQYMEVNDCQVICRDSGYGTFGDHDTHNVFNRTKFRVYDYVSISGSSSKLEFNDCDMKSVKYGSMIFGNTAGELPEVWMRGGKLDVVYSGIQVNGSNAYIYMDGVEVKTRRFIIHSEFNYDPLLEALDPAMYGKDFGVKAVLKNMDVTGDILNTNHSRDMAVLLENTSLKGSIGGAYLTLESSSWFATADSEVCLVNCTDISGIDAPAGVTISAVPGEGCTLSGCISLPSGGKLDIVS